MVVVGRTVALADGTVEDEPLRTGVRVGVADGRRVVVAVGRRVGTGVGRAVGCGVPGMTSASPALERPASRIG